MMKLLETIGRTRILPLRHIVPEGSAEILLKLEFENPTGSMKDRMALAMVETAEADGRLRPGGSVVEYTGGSTGVSLAFVCAAKRIPLRSLPRTPSVARSGTTWRRSALASRSCTARPEERRRP